MTFPTPRRGRYQKTLERRQKLHAMLKDGRRVHGDTLHQSVMPDRSKAAFRLLLRGMRDDGYDIRADGVGLCCRGYMLKAVPA